MREGKPVSQRTTIYIFFLDRCRTIPILAKTFFSLWPKYILFLERSEVGRLVLQRRKNFLNGFVDGMSQVV